MVDAATSFKKAGYSEEDSAQLALVASLYQNIADEALTAGESADFIISQMKAFNLTAADSEHIVNAVNEISNNMALSSADLATNIGKASAALAVGNNTYEESLSLMAGIVEVTRSGAKAARGLVSVQSRLNQTIDESSSTGKALTKWYSDHNIAILDQTGQLRSLYDVLTDVAKIWPDLTTNEKDYYLNQQAGANQTQNLAAALNNFSGVQKAYTLAMNSANSAADENARYMESINAHVQTLKATFQDFSRNVFNEEFIKRIIDTANALLEFVNTPFGQAATRITLLSTALFGLGGVLKGYWKYFVQGSAIAKGIRAFIDVSSLSGPSITGWEKFGALLPKIGAGLKSIAPFAAIFALLVAAVKAGTKKLDDYNATLEKTAEIQEKISSTQTEYDELINKTGDLTEAEKKRLEVLEATRAEQEAALEAAKKEKWEKWNALHGTGAKTVVGGGEGVGGGLGTGAVKTVTADVYALREYSSALADIEVQYKNGEISAGAYYTALQELNNGNAESVSIIRAAMEAGYAVTEQQRQLVYAYDRVQQILGITTDTTYGYVDSLIEEAREAGNSRQALLDVVQAEITASNSKLDFSQQVTALQRLAMQAGYTAQYVSSVLGASTGLNESNIKRTAAGLMQTGEYKDYNAAYAEAVRRAQSGLKYQWDKLVSTAPSSGWSEKFSISKTDRDSTTKAEAEAAAAKAKAEAEKKAAEARQSQIKSLQKEKDAIQDTIDAINDKYDAQIEALEKVNDELEDEIELQQILEEMARAKSTKKMVYKDGRFQYVSDIDAVAAAQVKLDEYNRKKALKDQKEFIEKQREAELAWYEDKKKILENQIKQLQDYTETTSTIRQIAISDMESQASQAEAAAKRIQDAQALASQKSTTTTKTPSSSKSSYSNGGSQASQKPTTRQESNVYQYDTANVKKRAAELLHSGKASSVSEAFRLAKAGYAKGTTRAAGGLSVVGEQGPELRVLNQGDGILPNQITKNLMAIGSNPQLFMQQPKGSCSTIVNVANVTLPDVKDARGFVTGLKNMALQKTYARQ